jgi:hypothetical protein
MCASSSAKIRDKKGGAAISVTAPQLVVAQVEIVGAFLGELCGI